MATRKSHKRRVEARILFGQGLKIERIAHTLGVSPDTVFSWRRADRAAGLEWAAGDWRACLARPCATSSERLAAVLDGLRARGLSQKSVAQYVGVSRFYLSQVKAGRWQVSASMARRFEAVLGTCSSWLERGACRMSGKGPSRD